MKIDQWAQTRRRRRLSALPWNRCRNADFVPAVGVKGERADLFNFVSFICRLSSNFARPETVVRVIIYRGPDAPPLAQRFYLNISWTRVVVSRTVCYEQK